MYVDTEDKVMVDEHKKADSYCMGRPAAIVRR